MRMLLVIGAALVVVACDRGGGQGGNLSEMQWARIALERNPQIEVLASDPQGAVFTIRDKASGEVRTVKLSEIAAAPAAQLAAPAAPTAAAAAPESQTVPAAPQAPAEPAATESPATNPEEPAALAEAPATQPTEYTIERTDGQLKVSGKGISIVSSGASASGQSPAAPKAVDPIICEGRRTLQLDNRDIYVDGDAITARGGCELYITNSRIVATGTGVIADDSVVHIYNSYVEGGMGSFEAGIGAKLYVRGSTFKGLSRRDSLASVQDQGGNQWH
jgi:hypothetical protein